MANARILMLPWDCKPYLPHLLDMGGELQESKVQHLLLTHLLRLRDCFHTFNPFNERMRYYWWCLGENVHRSRCRMCHGVPW